MTEILKKDIEENINKHNNLELVNHMKERKQNALKKNELRNLQYKQ